MTPHFRRKRAFTLVELLVVIAIIAFLAALIIAFFPSINAQTSEANGAINLQGWLNIARQKAIRNQNPYGLRLWVKDPTLFTPTLTFPTLLVSECQYIEQPDDFPGSANSTITMRSSQNNGVWDTVQMTGADPTGGFFPDTSLYPVQPGDYFEVLGTGLMHRIGSINTNTINPPSGPPIPAPSLSLTTPAPFQFASGTVSYRILRGPRVIGSETLPLPGGVFVDLQTNITFGNAIPINYLFLPPPPIPPPPSGAYVDVLFSPSGSVLTQGVTGTTMNFWVRQPDTNNPGNFFAGNPTIIAVFIQTGFVGAYPPSASSPAGPYVDVH